MSGYSRKSRPRPDWRSIPRKGDLTVLSAEQEEFVDCLPDFELPPGWGVWVVPSWKMKTDRPHNIPLPPSIWLLVQDAKRLAGKSKWLFPQLRERRRGAGMDGHVSEKVINDALERIGLRFGPHDLPACLCQITDE